MSATFSISQIPERPSPTQPQGLCLFCCFCSEISLLTLRLNNSCSGLNVTSSVKPSGLPGLCSFAVIGPALSGLLLRHRTSFQSMQHYGSGLSPAHDLEHHCCGHLQGGRPAELIRLAEPEKGTCASPVIPFSRPGQGNITAGRVFM